MIQIKEADNKVYNFYIAAAGDKPNENVVKCKVCRLNGFPHGPIDFRKVNSGRIKNDGSYEFEHYDVLNYFDGTKHEHRRRLIRGGG